MFNSLDIAYCDLVIKTYRVCTGFEYVIRDIVDVWSDQPLVLSQHEYEFILDRLEFLSRLSRKFMKIESYQFYPIQISKYTGKSKIQQMAELLSDDI